MIALILILVQSVYNRSVKIIEYTRVAHGCTLPPVWLLPRVGHHILLCYERIVLLLSFKERNVLLRSFFEF